MTHSAGPRWLSRGRMGLIARRTKSAIRTTALAVVFGAFLVSSAAADPTTEARKLLEFCKAHPEVCSLSIHYKAGGQLWDLDYNGSRLNSLASTIKIIHLISYANAASENRIDPEMLVSRELWSRFWIGLDGGALNNAYTAFTGTGTPPSFITVDQLVEAMIRYSDNAAPDYLLDRLGSDYIDQIIGKYVASESRVGYVDSPKSINGNFTSWLVNPDEPTSGQRYLNDYSGFESDEYRAELDQIFDKMHTGNFVSRIRQYVNSNTPWDPPPPAPHGTIQVNEQQSERLLTGYNMRSNTRTYNQIMLGLLLRNLIPAKAQPIVEKFLEWRLHIPNPNPLLADFSRYGIKDGDLAGIDGSQSVRTRTGYAERKDGTQVVATIQLSRVAGTNIDLISLDTAIQNFIVALATDPAFAREVQTGLPPDANEPSLIARVEKNLTNKDKVHLEVSITNIGKAATTENLMIALFLSDDHTKKGAAVDMKAFEPLAPGHSAKRTLEARRANGQNFLIVEIDPTKVIPDRQKQNNPQFERLPAGK